MFVCACFYVCVRMCLCMYVAVCVSTRVSLTCNLISKMNTDRCIYCICINCFKSVSISFRNIDSISKQLK